MRTRGNNASQLFFSCCMQATITGGPCFLSCHQLVRGSRQRMQVHCADTYIAHIALVLPSCNLLNNFLLPPSISNIIVCVCKLYPGAKRNRDTNTVAATNLGLQRSPPRTHQKRPCTEKTKESSVQSTRVTQMSGSFARSRRSLCHSSI